MPLVTKIVSAVFVAVIVYFFLASVWAYLFGNDEAETKIDAARAGAVIDDAQSTFEDLAEIDNFRENNERLITLTQELIATAKTQAEKDAIAKDALCQIDPEFCKEKKE